MRVSPEEGVSGRVDTDLANGKGRICLDERVYPRIDDEGAAFVVYVGDDEILWLPTFREHDFNVDDSAGLELAPYRFAALVIGEGVAELRHLRGPLLFQVGENLLGVRQRLGDCLDLDQVVFANRLPRCVVAFRGQSLEAQPAIGLDGYVETLALRSAEKLEIGLPQGLHTAPVLDLQRLANQFVEFCGNQRLLTPAAA